MADEWAVAKPIDHTLISDLPGEHRSRKTNTKTIIEKEHLALGDSNSGGQHKKGSARVYLQSGLATTDPEANGISTSDTTDNGRINVDSTLGNLIQVFAATSAGVSTSWEQVTVGKYRAAETGTQSLQAVHVGQIDTGYFALNEPATSGELRVKLDDVTIESSHAVGLRSKGGVVQVVSTQDGAVATGTTVLPSDDTIPQITEGDECMTLAITPAANTNKLRIDVVVHAAFSVADKTVSAALFQDTTANALAAGRTTFYVEDAPSPICFTHYMSAGTTSETTFRVRIGGSDTGTTTFNGGAEARRFGGVMASSITITEIRSD